MLTASKVTNVRRADVQSSQSLAEEYYECRTNDFFSKHRWTTRGQTEKCTILLTSELTKKFKLFWNQLNEFSKESLDSWLEREQCNDIQDSMNIVIPV